MNGDTKPDSPAPAPLRASDADREATADVLRTGFEQGRLTTEEFDERLQTAYNARTHADLAALTGDLPAPAAPPPAPRPSRRAAQVRDHVLTYVIFMLFFIGIWAARLLLAHLAYSHRRFHPGPGPSSRTGTPPGQA